VWPQESQNKLPSKSSGAPGQKPGGRRKGAGQGKGASEPSDGGAATQGGLAIAIPAVRPVADYDTANAAVLREVPRYARLDPTNAAYLRYQDGALGGQSAAAAGPSATNGGGGGGAPPSSSAATAGGCSSASAPGGASGSMAQPQTMASVLADYDMDEVDEAWLAKLHAKVSGGGCTHSSEPWRVLVLP
jgi:hypothetical protein